MGKGYRILQIYTVVCKHFEYSMTISAKSFQRMVIFLLNSLNVWFIKNLTSVILNAYLCESRTHLDLRCCGWVQKCAQLKDPYQLCFGIWGLFYLGDSGVHPHQNFLTLNKIFELLASYANYAQRICQHRT